MKRAITKEALRLSVREACPPGPEVVIRSVTAMLSTPPGVRATSVLGRRCAPPPRVLKAPKWKAKLPTLSVRSPLDQWLMVYSMRASQPPRRTSR